MITVTDIALFMGLAWMISGIGLLTVKKLNSQAGKFGILLLLVMGLSLVDNLTFFKSDRGIITFIILLISRNSYFIIGPILLFYTRSLIGLNKYRLKEVALHLFPFFLWIIYSLFNQDSVVPMTLRNAPPVHRVFSMMMVKESFSFISRISYGSYVLLVISEHRKRVPDLYSGFNIRNTLSWLFYLTLFYILLFSISFVMLLLPPVKGGLLKSVITEISRIVPSISFLLIFSILSGDQNRVDSLDKQIEEKKVKKDDKYTKSGITDSESVEIFGKLKNYLIKGKAYLDPDLTLDQLAEELNISRHKISQSINRESGDRFYSLINNLRLDEFLDAMENNRFPDFTIISVAFECGFKSSSAFYNLFKKRTGKTPKLYFSMVSH